MILNVINLISRPDRRESVIEQLDSEGVSYLFWDGIITKERKVGIHHAHKSIIRYAKENKLPYVAIAEDDLRWTAKGAWNYFLKNIPKESFDLYLSSYYSGMADSNNIINKFSGLSCYICAERFYDKFLGTSEKYHLDTALGMTDGVFYVSPLFCVTQAPGYSDQRKMMVNDSKRLIGKPMFHG